MALIISAIKSAGGDYSSLSAWYADKQGDLVLAGNIEAAACYDDFGVDGLLDQLIFSGSTTDANNYFRVFTPLTERHDGTPNNGFKVYYNQNFQSVIVLDQPYTVLEGLIVQTTASNGSCIGGSGPGEFCRVDSCLLGALSQQAIQVRNNCMVWNTIVWDAGTYGFRFANFPFGITIYNCLAANCLTGYSLSNGSGIVFRNCVAVNNGTAGFNISTADEDYCASDDTSVTGANSIQNISLTEFVDPNNFDFHLATGSVDLKDNGLDLSVSFDYDIDGDSRPQGAGWDIGPDELVSGNPPETINFSLAALSVFTSNFADQIPFGRASLALTANQFLGVNYDVIGFNTATLSQVTDNFADVIQYNAQLIQLDGLTFTPTQGQTIPFNVGLIGLSGIAFADQVRFSDAQINIQEQAFADAIRFSTASQSIVAQPFGIGEFIGFSPATISLSGLSFIISQAEDVVRFSPAFLSIQGSNFADVISFKEKPITLLGKNFADVLNFNDRTIILSGNSFRTADVISFSSGVISINGNIFGVSESIDFNAAILSLAGLGFTAFSGFLFSPGNSQVFYGFDDGGYEFTNSPGSGYTLGE